MIRILVLDENTNRVISVEDKEFEPILINGISYVYHVKGQYEENLLTNTFYFSYNIGVGLTYDKPTEKLQSELSILKIKFDLIKLCWEHHICFLKNTDLENKFYFKNVLTEKSLEKFNELAKEFLYNRELNSRKYFTDLQNKIMNSDSPHNEYKLGMASFSILS